ncbi:MAG: PorV/PorQ family protein [Candidatus Marinimicrobia bacterium]|nr:PorV/PorQ family protein [Candidatus Neomarinimicrobiota bacterium]
MRIGNTNRILAIFLILAMTTSLLVAGDPARVGTSSGDQVKVPVGSRNLAMGGADIASTKNIDAIFWNPAGLGELQSGNVAGLFSSQRLIADISTNYFAMGFNVGIGVLGISLKSFNFGDIDVTTVENMDGTGETFSPTYATGGITFARALTDKINFGVTGKVVYESIPRANATAMAVDFGIQYKDLLDVTGLNLGLSVRNVGSDMKYDGSAFLNEAEDVIPSATTSYTDFRKKPVLDSPLPTTMDMGLSYILPVGVGNLTLAGNFQHNNLENDQIMFGGEFEFSKMLFLRAGYGYTMEDADYEDLGVNVYGLSLGLGFNYSLMGVNTIFGYTYRPAEYFEANNTFTIGFEF